MAATADADPGFGAACARISCRTRMNVAFFCSENIAFQTLNSAEMRATQLKSVMPSSRSAAATVGARLEL